MTKSQSILLAFFATASRTALGPTQPPMQLELVNLPQQ